MTNGDDYLVKFLTTYFPQFPDLIITSIFGFLTSEYLADFLIHFPDSKIRGFSRNYYYHRLHFEITPSYNGIKCTSCGYKNVLVQGLAAVYQFMDNFPDVTPKTVDLIHSGSDFKDIMEILRKYHDIFYKIGEIHVVLVGCKITIEDFKYLLSLDNLKRLLLSRMDLRMIQSELNNNPRFSHHPNLASIEISYINVSDWSKVRFPDKLESLSMSTFRTSEVLAMKIPEGVNTIILSNCYILDYLFFQAKIPENLCRLYLVNAGLESIVVDELPVGLKYLSLAMNEIYTISGKSWPGSLEYLSLADNEFDDDAVKALVETIGWPPILKFLDISGNPVQHLQTLKRLPEDLQTLVVAEVSWKLSKRQVGEFPSNLTGLALHCCYFGNLSHFLFPPSLTSLTLIHNEIKDALSYGDWSQLTNLYKLDLSSNSIKSLDGWIIPPNLLQLRVNCNPIKKLTSKFPLFNRKYNFKLLRFEMRECKIKKVDIDYVPPNLKVFDLSTSKLPKSIVWPTTSTHFQQLLLPKNVECVFRSEKISVIE